MAESRPKAKMAAWMLPTEFLAEVKAIAVVTDTTQREIVVAALAVTRLAIAMRHAPARSALTASHQRRK